MASRTLRGFSISTASPVPSSNALRLAGCFALAAAVLTALAGCASQHLVVCPVSDSELTKQILAVAPLGTPRGEAVRRLAKAGIYGAFGTNNAEVGKDYYCCRVWRRPNGEEWKLNMLLHFNKSGALCETLDLPDLSPAQAKRART